MIYFIFGPDTFRSREKLKGLWEKLGKDFFWQKISAEELTLNELKKHFLTQSLFSAKKFLVVTHLCSKGLKNKEDILKFLNVLSYPKDEILIFFDEEVDKRSAMFKLMSKKADEQYEFASLSSEEMEIWLRRRVAELDLKINHENRKKMAAMLGSDSWLAQSELLKLKAYVGEREVKDEDIDLLVRARLDDDIFQLTDKIVRGETSFALKLLNDQLRLGNEEIYLLSMIIRQFRILIQIKSFLEGGSAKTDHYTLAKTLNLHPFVVQKSLVTARNYPMAKLKLAYQELLEIDLKMKTTPIPKNLLLEGFILGN